jgi:6-pyruvoyltetrahydropterin/6-carboxytetrahydropterin synthase
VTFEGPIREANGAEDGGMVLDFGAIKSVLMSKIHDPWDHAMLVWKNDVALLEAMRVMGDNHKTVVLPCVPTAEHLAQLVFDVLDAEFNRIYGSELRLVFVRLFETPNCWADAVAPNNVKGQ